MEIVQSFKISFLDSFELNFIGDDQHIINYFETAERTVRDK